MAIRYNEQFFNIKSVDGSSATLTEETGTTADGQILVVHTATDDGAGQFLASYGTVNYAGKQLQIKVVSKDRTTSSYKSDYDNAAEFESTVADGTGSSSSNSRKGGEYGTAAVSEELLAAVMVRYRTGAGVPTHKSQTFTPPKVVLDLCPLTTDRVVAGSVMFRWMGRDYQDFEGVIYRDRSNVAAGVACGTMDYDGGMALMYGYVVGGTGPTDFQLLSLWTQKGQWVTACLFFSCDAAPLRAGAGGFVLTVVDTKGTTLTANVDGQGNITGLHMRGRVEFSRGGVELQFGDFVLDANLTADQKAEWWYSPADVGAVQVGKVWRPWPVDPTTLRYSAVSYIYLPVDVSLQGIDPAALPGDGRVVFARPGELCVVGINHGGASAFAPTPGQT